MKAFHLRFCLDTNGWYSGFFDLLDGEIGECLAPDTGGAYVLGTSDGTMLTYPWGSSPIFYIGNATDLARRLLEHKAHILGARDDHTEVYWWPRYQYGAAFGAACAYYSRRGPQNPRNLEAELVESFYLTFGSIPAANSNWPKRITPKRS